MGTWGLFSSESDHVQDLKDECRDFYLPHKIVAARKDIMKLDSDLYFDIVDKYESKTAGNRQNIYRKIYTFIAEMDRTDHISRCGVLLGIVRNLARFTATSSIGIYQSLPKLPDDFPSYLFKMGQRNVELRIKHFASETDWPENKREEVIKHMNYELWLFSKGRKGSNSL